MKTKIKTETMKTKQVKEGYRSEKIRVGDTSIAKYSKLSKAARRVGLKNGDEVYAIYYKNPMTQTECLYGFRKAK